MANTVTLEHLHGEMCSVTTELKGVNRQLHKINGTNGEQWKEIAKIKTEQSGMNQKCHFHDERQRVLEKGMDKLRSALWKSVMLVIAAMAIAVGILKSGGSP